MENRILVVDDNTVSRESLKKLLSGYGKCETVYSGEQALRLFHLAHAKSSPYTLITLDIDMPGLNGKEVLESIREWEQASELNTKEQVKILMISAMRDVKEDIMKSFYLDCQDYIIKPATLEKLSKALEGMEVSKSG